MAITTSINQNLGNGYVQMDITTKNMSTKHYVLPEANVDSFTSEYEKKNKHLTYASNTAFIGGIIIGVFGAAFMLQKTLKSTFWKFILGTGAGILCSTIGVKAVGAYYNEKFADMLKRNNAKEIKIREFA